MAGPAYAVARNVAPAVAEHLRLHRAALPPQDPAQPPLELLPDARSIEALVDTAFWASVRREEGYVPKISLAFLRPTPEIRPLMFEHPIPLEPHALTHLAAAVERPGIHLGVWPSDAQPAGAPGGTAEPLLVWGTTHAIPPFCFVVEVIAPGLLVLKHRPRHESHKFVNVAVLEGDRIKVVDERASLVADCPALLTSMLGLEPATASDTLNVQIQLALSMRRHARGGILLMVPPDDASWRSSIVHPIQYAVAPPHEELRWLLERRHDVVAEHEWTEAAHRAIDAVAGLTAVDGATVMTTRYEVLAFGAKIMRRSGSPAVEEVVVSEPVEGSAIERIHPGRLGGTRHLSAAQFVHDQRNTVALVASQDGRFTIFSWATCDDAVRAHRVEVLLL